MKKLIFVYGTLKANFGNHRVIEKAKFLGEHTTEPAFTMYSIGGYPAVVPQGNTPIKGEIYEITDEDTMQRLCWLEGYDKRNSPHNHYNTMDIETPFGTTELFIYDKAPNRPVVETGEWVKKTY